jgi:dolichol-phosphate mannosyltransferase
LLYQTYTHRPLQSISIVVPLYNEEESIEQLDQRLTPVMEHLRASARVQLILVDDGSTDKTFELLHAHFGHAQHGHCEILQHPVNRGIAAAMRTGFRAATGQIVCTMDCDCTYAPEELAGMIRMLEEEHADIVTASPYHPAVLNQESSRRLFLSRMCSLIYQKLAPEKLYCYTSFFRVYRRQWTRPDMFTSDGFLGVTEILLTAAYCGAAIAEYPAFLGQRRFGRSKMRTLQVIREHLTLMGHTMRLNARLRLGRVLTPSEATPLYSIADGFGAQLSRLDFVGRWHAEPPWTAEVLAAEADVEHAEAI